MKVKIIITILCFAIGTGMVCLGFKLFISPAQLEMLLSKPIQFHLYSILWVIPVFILGGVETFALFRMVYKKNIHVYDIVTLPFVVSLWGFLIPFQGSYIYNSIYFKSKYKISLLNTTSVYLVSFSVPFIIAGILGIVYSCLVKHNNYFFLVSVLALVHPALIYFLAYFIRASTKYAPHSGKEKSKVSIFFFMIFEKVQVIITDYLNAINTKTTIIFASINIVNTLIFTIWSLRISHNFGFGFSFFQLLMLTFFIKFTLLFKITPGSMGVSEFASSAIILMLGGAAADGFALSLYQTTIFIIASLVIGSFFSVINRRYFYFKNQKLNK